MEIKENFIRLKDRMPAGIRIVVISKTRSVNEIMEVYSSGHRMLGENKVQEMVDKYRKLPGDIQWHMVGHLQSNKVKYIAPFISLIHSVDSEKLLGTVSREAIKNKRIIDCLLQVHIASEENKFGFSEEEVLKFLGNYSSGNYPGIRIRGLMGMATFTDDEELIRREFRGLAGLFRRVRGSGLSELGNFNELSMGMSGDYPIAIEEGSTMVRIGSLVFGERH
jgi:PLP dependent protein